jgi:acetyl esterase/lipase
MKAQLSVLASLATSLLVSAADPGSPAPAAAAPPPPPPPAIEDFARAPLMFGATLSPDGRHYAAIVSWEDERRGIAVMNIDEGKRVGGLRGGGEIDVYRLFWQGDDRLLFQISLENLYAYGLFSAPLSDLDAYIPIIGLDVVSVLGRPRSRPDRVLTWTLSSFADRGRSGLVNEVKVNRSVESFYSDESRKNLPRPVARYPAVPGFALRYGLDSEGELAVGIAWSEEEVPSLYSWDRTTSAWRQPIRLHLETLWPKQVDFDPAYIWVVTLDAAGSHLRRMKLADGTLEPPVYSDTTFDLHSASLVFSRTKRALVGLRFHQHRLKHVWFDPEFEQFQRAIETALPKDEDHRIIDSDEADRRFLVSSFGPRQPGVTHVYDRSSGQLTRATEEAPQLPRERLRPASAVRFTSRDGLTIHGYLTLPLGVSKERPAPLIVMPHGGPTARDIWRYDPDVQFLASRGYAVLQPNYRASSGYLWPNFSTTIGDFAGMRDDVIDATRSALRSGLFDPKRVAIMGGSFGGYLALACSTAEPDLYRAAISFAGVFDWARLLKKIEPVGDISYSSDIWSQRLGDPRRDRARFEEISVLAQLDRLRAPVLLAHGKIDRTVDYEQTKRLAAELRQRDHPHEVIYFQDAPHGLPAFKDRVAYYRAVESFLARHLASSP